MATKTPTLHLFCGKIAAGKSTLAAKLADEDGTILVAEDAWLAALFSDQMTTGQDFVRCSAKLRAVLGPHVVSLLKAGVSVVLDFQGNTIASRAWMRGLLEQSGADHRMHVLMPPDQVCLERLQARSAAGEHPFAITEEQFHRFSAHFRPPAEEEGFTLVLHEGPEAR